MKKITSTILCAILLLSSCVEKYLYNPKNDKQQKPAEEYFDFKTSNEVTLNIDYGFTDYIANFQLYLTNPYDEEGNRIEDCQPFFGAFTDSHTKFTGKLNIPSHIETVYICSDYLAIPRLLEVEVVDNTITYAEANEAETRTLNYQGTCYHLGNRLQTINTQNNLYAIYDNYDNTSYVPSCAVSGLFSTVSNNTQLTSSSTLGQLVTRIGNTLKKTNNTSYCSDSDVTNLRILEKTAAGEEVTSAHVDLVFLTASSAFHNAIGYYYYKSGSNPTAAQIKALPKYMVFPRIAVGKPGSRIKARLQFFGESYNENGVDHFPPGYTIGWMLVSDISKADTSTSFTNSSINVTSSYRAVYSNKECNNNNNHGCVTIWDRASEKIVIGMEDQAYSSNCGDKSYEDILFYVDCDPVAAVYDPNRPVTDDDDIQEEVLATYTTIGTLAFEDIWPSGGDYDMNDVIMEYAQEVTYNQNNMIKRIEDHFKIAHSGATLANGFGIVYNGSMGSIEEGESNYYLKEESNQFMITESVKTYVGSTYKIVRTYGEQGVSKSSYDTGFNPFIVPSYIAGEKNRKEVHLPKYTASSWADKSLSGTGNDAYYMDVNGDYPFAIELSGVTGWTPVTEASKIGSADEYPDFRNWADSKGTTHKDWYLYKNGKPSVNSVL